MTIGKFIMAGLVAATALTALPALADTKDWKTTGVTIAMEGAYAPWNLTNPDGTIGGFEADYFLYYEDTDISIRLRLLGYGLGLVPTAHIQHDYDFGKGSHKWFYIERNRYVFMLICWPLSVLLVLSPLLIVNELGLWAVSVIQRRFWSKVRASFSLLPMLPWIATKRRTAQKSRKISSADFMKLLEPRVDTPLLGSMPAFINALFVYYYRIALKLLG